MNAPLPFVSTVEFVAVMALAFSGFAEARKKDMDVVGVFTIALVTAFGGSTLRDVMLERRPFFWVQHQEYVVLILVLTVIASPLLRWAQRVIPESAFVLADAIGLGLFSIAGVSVSLAAGMPWIVAVIYGVITGVCGGILRDVILNEVPMVLRDGKPYALAAFVGCWVYLLLAHAGASEPLALWFSALLIVAVRILAWRSNWSLK
jgi:uncharacterized membrane protein YeiH